jgi:hypothetical protein
MTTHTEFKENQMIQTHALTHHYGTLVAVQDLDLAVKPGELFGFLGLTAQANHDDPHVGGAAAPYLRHGNDRGL